MKRKNVLLFALVVASSSIASFTVYAGCNSISASDTYTNDSGVPNCVKTIKSNQKCETPQPDDWSVGCDPEQGLVRKDTYNGTKRGFNISLSGVCGIEIGTNCEWCSYPGSPSKTEMVSGTIANTYACGD